MRKGSIHLRARTRCAFGLCLGVMLAIGGVTVPGTAQTLGMVVDDATSSVIVFDADNDVVLGAIPITSSGFFGVEGDCSITANQTLGFATNFASQLFVIDLQARALAAGTNPIPISNQGEDTSISPDQKFVAVCDGSFLQPVSVVDIATRAEISTFSLGTECNSVDICSDGSVLTGSVFAGNVRRLTLDGAGTLTDTGDVLASGSPGSPMNAYCAPGGTSGVVVNFVPSDTTSFTIPGLGAVDNRALSASAGQSGVINPAGNRVFIRSTSGAVDAFGYNAATGALSAGPLFSIPVAGANSFFGIEQVAIHPNGAKLYVSEPGAVRVFDTNTGAPLTTITHQNIVSPTGICVAPLRVAKIDLKPESNPNCVNPRSGGRVAVAIFGNDVNVADINQTTVTFGGAQAVRCSFEDVPMEGPTSVFTTDGILDLVCHFKTQEVTWPSPGSDCGTVGFTANLTDGTPLQGGAIACLPGESTCEAGTPIPVN